MRPWIRWSSLALALCNTGCVEETITYGCDADLEQTELLLPASGRAVSLSEFIGRKCRWQFVDSAGTAIPLGGGPIRFGDASSIEPYAKTVDTAASSASVVLLRSGTDSVDIADSGGTVGHARKLAVTLNVPKGRSVLSADKLRETLKAVRTTTVTVTVRTVSEESVGDYRVSPQEIVLANMSPDVAMTAEPPDPANEVRWDVVDPLGGLTAVLASRNEEERFIARYTVGMAGTYVFRAIVNGMPREAKTVQVRREQGFSLQPGLVEGYRRYTAGASDTLVAVSFHSGPRDETQGPAIHFASARQVDLSTGIPADSFGGVGASNLCGLASALNDPRYRADHQRLTWKRLNTVVSTRLSLDLSALAQTGFVSTEGYLSWHGFLEGFSVLQSDTEVLWSNIRNVRGLGTMEQQVERAEMTAGLYCVDACIVPASDVNSPRISEEELLRGCSDARRHCFGLLDKPQNEQQATCD